MLANQVWLPGTTLRLVKVNWDSSYNDVVSWGNQAAKDTFFNALPSSQYTTPQGPYTTIRPGAPIDLALEFNKVQDYNYIIVENSQVLDDKQRTYYYFINRAEYLSPGTTRVTLQLDTWTTFEDTTVWGQSFVVRGHLGIANSNANNTPASLRRYQSATESLDVGDVLAPIAEQAINLYSIQGQAVKQYRGARSGYPPDYTPDNAPETVNSGPMIIILTSVTMKNRPFGSVENPTMSSAKGDLADGVPQGCELWAMAPSTFVFLTEQMSRYPWITRNWLSIYIVPMGLTDWGEPQKMVSGVPLPGPDQPDWYGMPTVMWEELFYKVGDSQIGTLATPNVIDTLLNNLPAQYRKVRKLLTFPYGVFELNGPDGQSTFFKPQLLKSNIASVKYVANVVLPYARIGCYVDGYGNNGASPATVNQGFWGPGFSALGELSNAFSLYYPRSFTYEGDTLDSAVWFNNWPQLSVLNDNYINFLANSAYTRAYSYEAAGWGYERSTLAYQTAWKNSAAQFNAARDNAIVDVVTGGIGTLTAVASRDVGGTISGLTGMVGGAIKAENNLEAMATIMDNNYQLAQATTSGDYQIAIAGINAQVQQAQLTPPSQSGQRSGDGFGFGNALTTLRIRTKAMLPQFVHIVGDYFLRYGIAIQEFMQLPSNLACMTKFSYWKTSATNITDSAGNDTDRNVLSGILQKGVTVWTHPSYIGNTSLSDNEIVGGYAY